MPSKKKRFPEFGNHMLHTICKHAQLVQALLRDALVTRCRDGFDSDFVTCFLRKETVLFIPNAGTSSWIQKCTVLRTSSQNNGKGCLGGSNQIYFKAR